MTVAVVRSDREVEREPDSAAEMAD